MRTSKILMTGAVAAAIVAGSANASTYLKLRQRAWAPFHNTTESAFSSNFNYRTDGNKVSQWDRNGATRQDANPSSTYWGTDSGANTGGPVRSWEVSWNNTTKMFSTSVYDTSDWTGSASVNLSLATTNTSFGGAVDAGGDFILRGVAQFASGTAFSSDDFFLRVNARVDLGTNNLTGILIRARPAATAGVGEIVLSNVQFDGGNGFTNIVSAGGTFSGGTVNKYYTLSAVPAPGALALLGAAGLVGSRRRR